MSLNKAFDEVIFYDDASTDNTLQILLNNKCTVIRGETNCGPGHARNILAEKASGEWVHFHDIDDLLHQDYLVKTSIIAETNSYDVVLCNVDWCESENYTILLKWRYSNNSIQQNPIIYTITNPIGGINGLYKKTKFIESGGFDTSIRIWEDADMHVRLASNKSNFYIIEEVLSYALRYPVSASSDQTSGWLTRLNLLSKYFNKFAQQDIKEAIGQQAQVVASSLVLAKKYQAARYALKLSERCKVKVPQSKASLWKILKLIMPARIRIEIRILQLKIAFNK